MSNEIATVPSDYALTLLQTVEDSGTDTSVLLEELGISRQELEDSPQFSAVKYGQLYQRVMLLTQDECFGMFTAGKVRLGSFRLLCLTIIQCKNMRQALLRAGEFCEICRGFNVRGKLTENNGIARVQLAPVEAFSQEDFDAAVRSANPNQIRNQLAIWHRFHCWLIGREVELNTLYFSFPCPDEFKQMAEIYPTEFKFEQGFNGIEFPAEYLDYPIVQNQETLNDFLRSAPYHLVISDITASSLKGRVRSILTKDVSVSMPSAEEVASRLNLSVTTLRRRLQGEDTSFQRLKDECRMEAAFHYLGCPDLSNTDIAERLGFDETSAFFRAFKKWTGVTPGEYRKKLGR